MCTNVEGHSEPKFIVEADQDQLVESMVSCMNHIAIRVNELAGNRWEWVLESTNEKLKKENIDQRLKKLDQEGNSWMTWAKKESERSRTLSLKSTAR